MAVDDKTAFLITCAHVVAGEPSPRVEFRASPYKTFVATVQGREPGDENENPRGLALLIVTDPPPGVRALPLAKYANPVTDEKVIVGGFPKPLGQFRAPDTTIAGHEGVELTLTKETGPGFSGGPVLRGDSAIGIVFGNVEGYGKALVSDVVGSYLKGLSVPLSDEQKKSGATSGRKTGDIGVNPSVPEKVWTDPTSGLMWAGKDNGLNIDWFGADSFCKNLTIGNYSGWRLPDINELKSLYDQSATRHYVYRGPSYNEAFDGQSQLNHVKPGVDLDSCCAWSSTKYGPDKALYLRFQSNEQVPYPMDLCGVVRALCVRTRESVPHSQPGVFDSLEYRMSAGKLQKRGEEITLDVVAETHDEKPMRFYISSCYLLDENGARWDLPPGIADSGHFIQDAVELIPSTKLRSRFSFIAKGATTGMSFTFICTEYAPRNGRKIVLAGIPAQ